MPNTVSRYSRSKPRYSGAAGIGSSSAILLVVQLSPTYWHATHGQYVTICTRAQSKLYLNNHNIQDVYWNFRDVVVLDLVLLVWPGPLSPAQSAVRRSFQQLRRTRLHSVNVVNFQWTVFIANFMHMRDKTVCGF